MFNNLVIFAGPVCFGPTTEKESFIWALLFGAFLLAGLSVFFGLVALIIKLRNTFNQNRKRWAKRYGLSLLAFFVCMGLGQLIATGGTANDYCGSAESSIQGNVLMFLAGLAGLMALVSVFAFMFSFNKTSSTS